MSQDANELKLWLTLNAAAGIGPVRFHQILKGFRSLDSALGASAEELAKRTPALSLQQAGEALKSAAGFDAGRELEQLSALGARAVLFSDEDYPRSLAPLYAPAPVLYVRGRLPEEGRRAVAVVGTRTPTPYGLAQCKKIVAGLKDLSIISGLAKGIDASAHTQASSDKTPTFGILGSGLSAFYPSENRGLAEQMLACGGGVISQFHLDASPDKRRFPMRNAVISGLSSAVLVVEGEEDSGSLITAEWALEQGRDIYAVPGPADSKFSRGPNRLIQQGAKLVLSAQDILAEFPEFSRQAAVSPKARQPEPAASQTKPREELSGEEAKIYRLLAESGRMALDQLASKTGMAPGQLSSALTMLEIKGAVRQLPGTLVESI